MFKNEILTHFIIGNDRPSCIFTVCKKRLQNFCRPTVFLGVPRVWEKIMEGMLDKGKNVKGLQKKIADACKKAGLDHHLEGKQNNIMYTLGQKVCHKP